MDKNGIPVRAYELRAGDHHAPDGYVDSVKRKGDMVLVTWAGGKQVVYGAELIFIITREKDEEE